jgi:non-ribosomal peptide synthetase component F
MNVYIHELEVLGPLSLELFKKWSPSQFSKTTRCVHDFIDEHARNTPNKEAVAATEGPNLTYAQLSDISTKLAYHLVQIGVKRGDIVPILFDKSSYIVMSVIAIMKAGAAWVGFSVDTPINFLIECATIMEAPLVLTSEHRQELVEKIGRKPLVVDDNFVASLRQAPQAFYSPAAPTDVAYLVFTSGSTGTPKVRIGRYFNLHVRDINTYY